MGAGGTSCRSTPIRGRRSSLARRGTDYSNANIGSALDHRRSARDFRHGRLSGHARDSRQPDAGPDGEEHRRVAENADRTYMLVPTLSELWDEQNDNKPKVGTVSYEGWHLGMIGHGRATRRRRQGHRRSVGGGGQRMVDQRGVLQAARLAAARPTWRDSRRTRRSSTSATDSTTATGSATRSRN